MKKVYAILEVTGQGRPEPLTVRATRTRIGSLSLREYETIETFNSREAAEERGRGLVQENPTKTYHIVESVQAIFTDAPVKTHTF